MFGILNGDISKVKICDVSFLYYHRIIEELQMCET